MRSVVHHSYARATKVRIQKSWQWPISIPNYNGNFQYQSKFDDPLRLKHSCKISCDVTLDNTKLNPFNPDPNKTIRYGPNIEDEILICACKYADEN